MLRLILLLLFSPTNFSLVSAQSPARSTAPATLSGAVDLRQAAARVRAVPAHCHAHVKQSDLRLRLRNVLVDSALLWFHLQLYNRSRIAFHPAYCRFIARDRKGSRRRAIQSIELLPYRRPILGAVRYRRRYDLVIPFLPFALLPARQLVIEIGEAKSGRVLKLVLPYRTVLHARPLP